MTQPNEGRSFSWQTAIAIGGLIATLIGLWISYQGKEKELEQAQAKIETTYREGEERKQNKAKKRAELDGRMLKIDADINATELGKDKANSWPYVCARRSKAYCNAHH